MKEEGKQKQMVFYPDFLFREAVAALIVVVAIVALSLLVPIKVGDPADPSDSSFKPVPEWYFMAPYYALKLFPASLEVVPAVAVPSLAFVLLVVLPFIDRKEERRPKRRPLSMALIGSGVLMTALFTMLGILSQK